MGEVREISFKGERGEEQEEDNIQFGVFLDKDLEIEDEKRPPRIPAGAWPHRAGLVSPQTSLLDLLTSEESVETLPPPKFQLAQRHISSIYYSLSPLVAAISLSLGTNHSAAWITRSRRNRRPAQL